MVGDATQPKNLGAALHRGARYDDTALIDLGGRQPPKTYTFRDIDKVADAVARGLAARGYPVGSRIAIVANNRMEFMAVFLGAMRAGMVSVPLNFKQPAATLDYMLKDCDAKLVFFDAERALVVPPAVEGIGLDDAGEGGFAAFIKPGEFTAVEPDPRDAAMFLYTSGSSGTPKGVVLSHESHLWVLRTRARLATSIERVLIAAPLYHMNGLGTLHASLHSGNSVVLMPGFNVPDYIDAIRHYRVTWITAVPPMIAMLLQRPDLLQKTDMSSVRLLRMGSAPVSQSLLDETQTVFATAVVSNVYGTTEAGPISFGAHPKGVTKPSLSVGVPVAEVAMRLVDDAGGLADQGVLHIKSPALMTGYHNKPDETKKAISDDGYFVSGDVFRRDKDGFYFFVGRADDMFVSGGENIYPGEVEKMIEQQPGVRQVCVVPIDDAIKGTKPVAFVVPQDGVTLEEQQVKDYALKHAAPYLHPRRVWFLNELPLAGTNKIDRKALMRMAVERMADTER